MVTAFLFQNGVSSYWIRVFYRANCSLRDDAAWRDVESLLQQFGSDESRRTHKFYAFDLIRGRVCWLDGTSVVDRSSNCMMTSGGGLGRDFKMSNFPA